MDDVPLTRAADGRYTAVASQDDNAGNTGDSAALHFRVDTVAPAPTITGAADTNDTTPAFGSQSTVSQDHTVTPGPAAYLTVHHGFNPDTPLKVGSAGTLSRPDRSVITGPADSRSTGLTSTPRSTA